ncbi:hypothetical protein [Pedobacter sp. PACM 27299]|uniref:hypothetical protein n=1 Tax=Pedobacter sp. PACM 27299 TaxID=1727164 RepID=UPI000A91AE5D|nr:hypothetical protein [Pedobacter sp. PACM 27299]
MKFRLLISSLVILGCETKKMEAVNEKFSIGNINNYNENDTAFVSLKRNIETDEIECGENNCLINIEFTENIPKISIDQSLGVFISKTGDLNEDKANEIIIFSRTNEGYWHNISVWSFKGSKWNEIAKTRAFISENLDFENRITKEDGNYYLIGENQWEEDKNGDFKKIKVKI